MREYVLSKCPIRMSCPTVPRTRRIKSKPEERERGRRGLRPVLVAVVAFVAALRGRAPKNRTSVAVSAETQILHFLVALGTTRKTSSNYFSLTQTSYREDARSRPPSYASPLSRTHPPPPPTSPLCVFSLPCLSGQSQKSAPGLFDPSAIKRDVGDNWALKLNNLKKVSQDEGPLRLAHFCSIFVERLVRIFLRRSVCVCMCV